MPARFKSSNQLSKIAAAEGRRAVRAVMHRLGYEWAGLAPLTGFSRSTLTSEYSRGFPNPRVRAALEDALGVAIFTAPAAFKLRQHHKALLGIDPTLITRDQLRALAQRSGLVGATHEPNRKALLGKVLARLEVIHLSRPKPTTPHRHE